MKLCANCRKRPRYSGYHCKQCHKRRTPGTHQPLHTMADFYRPKQDLVDGEAETVRLTALPDEPPSVKLFRRHRKPKG